jgi:hypothetical protein
VHYGFLLGVCVPGFADAPTDAFLPGFYLSGRVGDDTAYLGYSRALVTWFDRRRGFALSVMLAGGGRGARMILPLIAQTVITRYGWRQVFALRRSFCGNVQLTVRFPEVGAGIWALMWERHVSVGPGVPRPRFQSRCGMV